MQSIFNLQSSCGLPICLSGITRPRTVSTEMADHDRRREAMKRHKSQSREVLHVDQEMGLVRNHERIVGESREGEIEGDLAAIVRELSYRCLQACTAKAA
ncbi:hypothetical protein RJ639_038682 [Escallonia herrerae]|uniref:Uncharacterized protein n=1 Tax=Escallonia herrerae TaxID=1293975 RepID=A0AA88WJB0_9ASTE|nr:hypothetical protein RJ639_038682 [Escallonia herrerae]